MASKDDIIAELRKIVGKIVDAQAKRISELELQLELSDLMHERFNLLRLLGNYRVLGPHSETVATFANLRTTDCTRERLQTRNDRL